MKGKGWAGSTASGVRRGSTWSTKYWSSQPRISVSRSSASRTNTPASRRSSFNRAQTSCWRGLEAPDHLGDLAKLLGGGAAVDARRLVPAPQQSEKAGDPDNEEFIQVLAGDGEEPYPLQEGMGDILGLVENALVEAKPGELPVEEPYRACRVEVEERPRTGRRIQEIRREGAEGRAGLLFGCRLAHAILLCAAL